MTWLKESLLQVFLFRGDSAISEYEICGSYKSLDVLPKKIRQAEIFLFRKNRILEKSYTRYARPRDDERTARNVQKSLGFFFEFQSAFCVGLSYTFKNMRLVQHGTALERALMSIANLG